MALAFARQVPFIELLGAELLSFEGGISEIGLTLRDELCNSWQVAHGGVVMTLLDVAMAHATRVPRRPEEGPDPRGVVTIEMKTTFMRPALGRVVCTGRLLHRSAALAFCEGTLVDADGQRLAHATGTFKFLAGLPAGGRRIHSPEASD
jgi:uncharacterized protein (TIGR00369 family)